MMIQRSDLGVADLRYESSAMELLKPRLKLTFGYMRNRDL